VTEDKAKQLLDMLLFINLAAVYIDRVRIYNSCKEGIFNITRHPISLEYDSLIFSYVNSMSLVSILECRIRE